MGTRAAAFSAKIKSLRELQEKVTLNIVPVPTGSDLATSYRWFSTTLLSILRDVPGLPYHMLRSQSKDAERLGLFPSLDYKQLYDTLYEFIPDLRLVPSSVFYCGKALLTLFTSLLPFMDRDTIQDFPFNITELIDILPVSLCSEAVEMLCDNILPFIMKTEANEANSQLACVDFVPAMIQTTLYKSPTDMAIHRKLLECLMAHKPDVDMDLLHVIAYGPTSAKLPAANLLFFYWPSLNPTSAEKKDIADRFRTENTWIPPICSSSKCGASEPAEASKMCLDHSLPLNQRSDLPPPAFFCSSCVEKTLQSRPKSDPPIFEDINLPIDLVAMICENKNCRSSDKIGTTFCFSTDCTSYNSNRPIRYCQQCDRIRHNTRRGINHVLQKPVISPWDMKPEDREVMLSSIISLLALAKPYGSDSQEEHHTRTINLLDDEDQEDQFTFDDYLLASRYGIWLLVGLCMPKDENDQATEMAGLLSMLFEWYKVTATLPNDKSGALIEKIKSDFIPPWLRDLSKKHPQLFVQCLIPDPDDSAKVGGHWEISAPETYHIKEGLARLFCLVSFDIIKLELWSEIAPRWMEAIEKHYLKESLPELGSVFCKIFDPDMSPLGFQLEEMYHFAITRMKRADLETHTATLGWMQILCELGVTIPLDILFNMYSIGLKQWSSGKDFSDQQIFKLLHIYSRMLDVILVQFRHQDIEENLGLSGQYTQNTLTLALDMINSNWLIQEYGKREKKASDVEVDLEENLFIFSQLFRNVMRYVLCEEENEDDCDVENSISTGHTVIDEEKKDVLRKPGGVGGFMAVLSSTFKTTVETIPDEESDSDSTVTDMTEEGFKEKCIDIEDHPVHIQLLSKLCILLSGLKEPDTTFYLLEGFKFLSLNEEGLSEASRKHKKLFTWLQHNHIIPTFWRLLDANHSQIAMVSVPILMHSITLKHGLDIIWKILDEDFSNEDWKVRFAAVEKVTLLFRFIDTHAVKQSQSLRSAVTHAYCLLIAAMDDINVHVSQRATLYIGTVHDKGVQSILWCLECQFSKVPEDRPIILKRIHQMFNVLNERRILTWEFFATQLDVLIGDIQDQADHPKTFGNGAGGDSSDPFVRSAHSKLRNKSGTDSVRSLALSMQHNSVYKRTQSAPAGMASVLRQPGTAAAKQPTVALPAGCPQEDRFHIYYKRQQSTPMMKHIHYKTSKAGSEHGGPVNISRLVSQSGTVSDDFDYKDIASKSVDVEPIFKETLHLLVFLLMQYLSHPHQGIIPENKSSLQYISMQKTLQNLFLLIGFDDREHRFTTMPHRVRSTAQFSSFFANLAQVMDNNFNIGNLLLVDIVQILLKSPFPPRYAANWLPTLSFTQENLIFQGVAYTLWHLEMTVRKNWLETALVLVYKYNFSEPETISDKVNGLMRIIINTLASQVHICSKEGKNEGVGLTLRSRELSETSIGALGTTTLQGTEENSAYNSRASPTSIHKEDGEELEEDGEVDDIFSSEKEPELETIFENAPRSSSSSNNSSGKATKPKNISMENPLFYSLLPPSSPHSKHKETGNTNQAPIIDLPPGWTMEKMDNGRIVYSDKRQSGGGGINGSASTSKSKKRGPFFNSPPSPLSLMDVLTVGGPAAGASLGGSSSARNIDRQLLTECLVEDTEDEDNLASAKDEIEDDDESEDTVGHSQGMLQPAQERLLPIGFNGSGGGGSGCGGATGQASASKRSQPSHHQSGHCYAQPSVHYPSSGKCPPPHHGMSLLDRVWQVLGANDEKDDCVPLVDETACSSINANNASGTPTGNNESAATYSADCGSRDASRTTSGGMRSIAQSNKVHQITSPTESDARKLRSVNPAFNANGTNGLHSPVMERSEVTGPTRKLGTATLREPLPSILQSASGGAVKPSVLMDAADQSEQQQAAHPTIESAKAAGVCGHPSGGGGGGGGNGGHQHGAGHLPPPIKSSNLRLGEDTVIDRCSRCGAIRETYTQAEISLAIVVLNTYVHRDPELAAPLLPEIFLVVSRIASKPLYSWEQEGSMTIVPGNPRSVARQFMRVTLHQLASNGLFPLLFKLDLNEQLRSSFFSTMVSCLNDFTDLAPSVPLQMFFESVVVNIKQNIEETLTICLPNMTCYLSFCQFEHSTNWSTVFSSMEMFYRSIALMTSSQDGTKEKVETQGVKNTKLTNIESVLRLVVFTMKMPGIGNHRSILEPIIKIITFAIQFCTFRFQDLVDICSFCNKAFNKERDKNSLTRAVIAEFVHALKYKTSIPDVNFLYLGSMVLQDAKGELPPSSILEERPNFDAGLTGPIHTGATECLRLHVPDIVEFVADVHTLSKVKSNVRGTGVSLNQDTLGGILKATLSQFLALEIARMSGDKDTKMVTKYLPWLFNPPNTIATQGPKEFLDCVSHIRMLSWLLLGAVNYTLLVGCREDRTCQPIPLEASCHIADHIEVILAGFAEQSKASVVHMCSLFHAFILCQLWTVYLENVQPTTNNKDELLLAPSILMDFWVKVTPGILQLVSHSKVLAEMVNLHFLSLMEAMLESRSTILVKLMPLWCPVLQAYNVTLPDHIWVRLQSIQDAAPQPPRLQKDSKVNTSLVNWLQRLQFKMGQIELQASVATQQFFSV